METEDEVKYHEDLKQKSYKLHDPKMSCSYFTPFKPK